MSALLPVVDISPFRDGIGTITSKHQETINQLREALLNQGFFYLTGHGIPKSTTDEILSLARRFFQQDAKTKQSIKRQDPGIGLGDGARGYQVIGESKISSADQVSTFIPADVTQGSRDWHEGLDWYRPIHDAEGLEAAELFLGNDGIAVANTKHSSRPSPFSLLHGINLWPSCPSGFRAIYEDYVTQVLAVGTLVLRAMGHALDLNDPEFFVRHTRESFWVMRAIGYPPLDSELASQGGVSCGEHSDYGCLTLLLQDETKGALMVKGQGDMEGEWIIANPVEGAYVVNVGDMVELWTGGLVKSTKHRVIHTGANYRVSVPFFMEPDRDCLVKPLGECIERLHKVGAQVTADKEITYWNHLVSKVGGNFYANEKIAQ